MRILQVMPTYVPAYRYGGPIRSVHGLSCALVRLGHEVQVYTTSMDGDQDLHVQLEQPVDIDGVTVSYFAVPYLRRLARAPKLAERLRQTATSFDVIHIHSVFLWPTWAASRIAARLRIPYFISPRGMLLEDLIKRKSRWVKTAWINLIEADNIAGATGIHVTTDLEATGLRALGIALPEIHCVPNGITWPDRAQSLTNGPFAWLKPPYALFLSRISWKKGIERLIRAWQHVENLPLIIAGNDDEQYIPKLESLAQQLRVLDRIKFIGSVSDTHKWALYQNAEMFILPSYSENFGNVVAEAMAMGCPVIVTPEVGLADMVRKYRAGLITTGAPENIAAKVIELSTNDQERRRMGASGKRAAIEQLSWDSLAKQVESMYSQALLIPP